MEIIYHPSPNFGERAEGLKPEIIVLHSTGLKRKTTESVLWSLSNPENEVSVHYMIALDGLIYQMVNEEDNAWHAGGSRWKDLGSMNSRSIGIEFHNYKSRDYTEKQIISGKWLCHDIMQRHNIPAKNVLAHSDISPHRKEDPGDHFPWQELANEGIGVWPEPSVKDAFNAAAVAKDKKAVKELLEEVGYHLDGFRQIAHGPIKTSFNKVVKAFQLRFEPEVFEAKSSTKPGVATETTVARLRALIRMGM